MDDLGLGKYSVLILDYQGNLSFHVSFIYKSPGFGGTNMNKNGLIVITDDEDVNKEDSGPIVISDDEDLVESAEEGDYVADVANGDKDSGIISLGPNPPTLPAPFFQAQIKEFKVKLLGDDGEKQDVWTF